jgi:hypothetical protein
VAEWLKAAVLKTAVRVTVPWVRIPPPPPIACYKVKLMFPKISLVFAALAILTTSASAQTTDFETVLLPITLAQPVPGAYGSLWATDLRVYADAGDVVFRQFVPICLGCLPFVTVSAGTTRTVPVGRIATQPLGTFVLVSRATVDHAVFNLRVMDLSRQEQTWGTEIPAVRERDFRTGMVTLINIPTDPRFRQALRVYNLNRDYTVPLAHFKVQIFDTESALLAEQDYTEYRDQEGPERIPGWVQITDLVAEFPQIQSAERVRVLVTAAEFGTKLWAFVSVTNNETQHVTTITPH